MHRRASLIALFAVLVAGAGCGTDKQPLKCQNDDACPADATCQGGLCAALPTGECRLPAACSPPANATATCDASHACGFACNDLYHLCSDACALESPDSCGSSCKKCDAPTNGSATCTDGTCGTSCPTGQHICSDACITESPTSCGAACTNCPVPASGSATCTAGQCGMSCDAGALLCPKAGGGIQCLANATQCPLTCDSDHVLCSSGCCSRMVAVAAGGGFACAQTSLGNVQCWGYDYDGQLGDGTGPSIGFSATPVDVLDNASGAVLSGVISIAAGGSGACALLKTSAVVCWGSNTIGQVGMGDTSNPRAMKATAVQDGATGPALTGAVQITVGANHGCALLSTGGVKCWGYNGGGQLGVNSTVSIPYAVDVWQDSSGLALADIAQVAAGSGFTCARTSQGGVKCWGANTYLQIGQPSDQADFLVPVDIAAGGILTSVQDLWTGGGCACIRTASGNAECWGDNLHGSLGSGSLTPRKSATPSLVSNLSDISAGSSGAFHSCVVTGSARKVECWGQDDYGQLGNNSTVPAVSSSGPYGFGGVPTPGYVVDAATNPITGVAQVSAGTLSTCALMTDGSVQCWGQNNMGQLGDGTRIDEKTPVHVLFQH